MITQSGKHSDTFTPEHGAPLLQSHEVNKNQTLVIKFLKRITLHFISNGTLLIPIFEEAPGPGKMQSVSFDPKSQIFNRLPIVTC